MNKNSLLKDYLTHYGAMSPWTLEAGALEDIEQVVVIPAYAEKEHLFDTLASLAANDGALLQQTLVICVVNHKASASADDKENNLQTLSILRALLQKHALSADRSALEKPGVLTKIAASPLRLALMDACSAGREISPKVGGVGMARKIGMDRALSILGNDREQRRLILSLDADTLVQNNYLRAIRQALCRGRLLTGVVNYAHCLPDAERERRAIIFYEIYLRYWVMGLHYAGSPYAFHTIGSTIATTTDAYLTVRGMNRRAAGEDFYFLNKLAKISSVRLIRETTVYPSARISQRVPFGTGAAVEKIVYGGEGEGDYPLYDPRVFLVLKRWIALMQNAFGMTAGDVLDLAETIDGELKIFLRSRGFFEIWPRIRKNMKSEKVYAKRVSEWFDGFETLKLVNHLTRSRYPRLKMSDAIREFEQMKRMDGGDQQTDMWNGKDPMALLQRLRSQTTLSIH